jgi:hypothetical protein
VTSRQHGGRRKRLTALRLPALRILGRSAPPGVEVIRPRQAALQELRRAWMAFV